MKKLIKRVMRAFCVERPNDVEIGLQIMIQTELARELHPNEYRRSNYYRIKHAITMMIVYCAERDLYDYQSYYTDMFHHFSRNYCKRDFDN